MPHFRNVLQRKSGFLTEGALQADTAVRHAANVLTFDAADAAEAAAYAAMHADNLRDLRRRFEEAGRLQDARAAYDWENRRGAVRAGEGLGYGLSFAAGGAGALKIVNRLSNTGKGRVGEGMSALKTIASGDVPVNFQKRIFLKKGGYTDTDQGTLRGKIVEAKYRSGYHPKLRGRQKQAQEEFGSRYRHDKWGPKHVRQLGGAAGTGAALGGQLSDEAQERWGWRF